MLPGITPALFGGAGIAGNDSDTLLLLHCDGADSGTLFQDFSPYARGNATVFDNAKTVTAQSKFGGSSAAFDGTGDYLSYPHSSDFNFGTGDFTIDCWVRFNSVAAQCAFASKWATATDRRQWLFVWFNSPAALRLNLSPGADTQVPREYPWTPVVNTWYHVAAVRKAGLVYLFVNGVILGAPIADSTNLIASTEAVRIGAVDNASGTPTLTMNGWIDELRISKVGRWTANFAPPYRAYSPDPDLFTKLLLHMDGPNGSSIFTDASYWKKGLAAVTGATVTSGPTKFGSGAGLFSGSSYITYPDHADYDFGTGDFTIDLWARVANLSTQYALFGKNNSSINNGFGIYVNTTKTVQCYWTSSDAGFASVQSAPLVNDTNFHHYALQRSGTLMQIYFDGVLAAQGSITAGASLVANTNLLTIGKNGDFGLFLNGGIDEFRVSKGVARYSGTFTPPVAAYPPADLPASGGNDDFTKLLMHGDGANGSTVFADSSLAAHGSATTSGAPVISTAQNKFGGSSILLNGSSALLYPAHADWEFGTGEFTIDWWEYRLSAAQGRVVITREHPSGTVPFLIGYENAGNVCIYLASTTSFDIANSVSIGAATLNVWQHFAVVRKGSNWYGFKNGVQTASFSNALGLAPAPSLQLTIGRYTAASQFFHGHIDELRISKGIARWTAPFTPPTGAYF